MRGRTVAAEDVVRMISACIIDLQAAGFAETADILAIARLDLLARLHGVSDEELELLIIGPKQTPSAKPEQKKSGKPSQNNPG